jgi:DNA-binding NarL/FixJ family response regulator
MRDAGDRTAVVLDRHPLWVEAMTRLLDEAGVEVVAKATDADQAVAAVEEFRPDMLIAGVAGGTPSEVACVRRAQDAHPELKSVVMGDDANPDAVESAFAAGASIYCVKTAERDDLASAIRQAFRHSIFVSSGERPQASALAPAIENPKAPAADLTRRELEILRLVAEGHSNSQLARMLWVTEQTVKFHLSNIYRKLDVSNRTEASRWAQVNGLLPATPVVAEAAVA